MRCLGLLFVCHNKRTDCGLTLGFIRRDHGLVPLLVITICTPSPLATSWDATSVHQWDKKQNRLLTFYSPISWGVTKTRAMHLKRKFQGRSSTFINPLTPNDRYSGRTALLTSKRYILYIYSTNIGTEYFKHGIYSPFSSLQNAVCFIILTYLVPVLFIFYIQSELKLKN